MFQSVERSLGTGWRGRARDLSECAITIDSRFGAARMR